MTAEYNWLQKQFNLWNQLKCLKVVSCLFELMKIHPIFLQNHSILNTYTTVPKHYSCLDTKFSNQERYNETISNEIVWFQSTATNL